MTDLGKCGGLFIALGIGLLFVGGAVRPHLLTVTTGLPFLVPALLAIIFGGYCLWRRKHPLR